MADDQERTNDDAEDNGVADYDANDGNEIINNNDISTTTSPVPVVNDATNPVNEDYADDEPLPDVTVKLYVNVNPDGPIISPELLNQGLTDMYGNPLPPTSTLRDLVDGYPEAITQGIYDELSGNGTDISGKGWWGSWSWNKALVVGFIGLCIIGIILAILLMIIGKKFKKNKRSPAAATTSATAVKGASPKTGYKQVPSSV